MTITKPLQPLGFWRSRPFRLRSPPQLSPSCSVSTWDSVLDSASVAVAAGNGWLVLCNLSGREKPHSSPSATFHRKTHGAKTFQPRSTPGPEGKTHRTRGGRSAMFPTSYCNLWSVFCHRDSVRGAHFRSFRSVDIWENRTLFQSMIEALPKPLCIWEHGGAWWKSWRVKQALVRNMWKLVELNL